MGVRTFACAGVWRRPGRLAFNLWLVVALPASSSPPPLSNALPSRGIRAIDRA
jgi:hypothetical protein